MFYDRKGDVVSEFIYEGMTLLMGDCVEQVRRLPENSMDSIVVDPPYHLTSTVKRFGKPGSAPAQFGTDGTFARASKGFMGKEWDGGDIAFQPATWAEMMRVLRPGGHLLAFGGSRTYHRLAVAIEDAGFEIRDQVLWIYGTGFPKSHDVSKAIDKRIAISGLMPERPLTIELSVLRLTPSALAVSVIEAPTGLMQSSFKTSPGCGGLCIFIISPNGSPHNLRLLDAHL